MWPFSRWRKRAIKVSAPPSYAVGNTGDPWGSLTGELQPAISPAAAESVAAVGAAVSAIATTLSSLPCAVVRADEERDEVPTHDLARLIRGGANPNETFQEFLETLVSTTLLRGNATARIDTDKRGRLVGLTSLPWDWMSVRVTDAGALLFDYTPTLPPRAGLRRTYARDDLLLLKDRSDTGLLGVSRLQRAGAAMAYAVQVQATAQTFSANASRPGGTLSAPGRISEQVAKRLAEDWDTNLAAGRRGKTAVLPDGLKWEPLNTLTAEDQQLIEARQWSVGDVARIFGVSPWLLGDSSRMTFASAREATRSFATLTLAPWCARVEASFQQSVLSPQYRLRFDIGSLTKADTEAHSAALLRGRQGGWLSPNDCREETGWPRVDGGDSIAPPVVGGAQPPGQGDDDKPAPPSDDSEKVARLDHRRGRT